MLERDPKRRRLTPLNAPFRSPLRRPSTPSTSTNPSTNPPTPSNLNPQSAKNSPFSTSSSTPHRRPPRQFKSPIFSRNNEEGLTPDIIELLQRKRELEMQIKEEKKALETAEIALKYEKQDEDENLEKLIMKWRRCAQKTAEQVFVTARNRIDGMGGYREFMINQKQRSMAFDKESEQQQNSAEQEDVVDEEEVIEDEFTMEIMLRIAGVEENLIGWDRELNNFMKE